jgi:hypothetical protein
MFLAVLMEERRTHQSRASSKAHRRSEETLPLMLIWEGQGRVVQYYYLGLRRPAHDTGPYLCFDSKVKASKPSQADFEKDLARHTFVSTLVKSTIASTEGPVPEKEMRALVERIVVP